jgi:hypothetical protein
MGERRVYHVTKRDDGQGWETKAEGAQRASTIERTKEEAVKAAAGLAKNASLGQVVIHKQDGTIQSERTYGKDPFPPEG